MMFDSGDKAFWLTALLLGSVGLCGGNLEYPSAPFPGIQLSVLGVSKTDDTGTRAVREKRSGLVCFKVPETTVKLVRRERRNHSGK